MFSPSGMKLRAAALTTIAASVFFVGCEIDGPPELPDPTPAPTSGDPESTPTPKPIAIEARPSPTPEAVSTETTPAPMPTPDPSVGALPYGIPVPGKAGFVISPHSRNAGYVDVRGFPPSSEVKDPYSGQTFLVP